VRRERLRRLAGFYVAVARTAVQEQFQYRAANYAYMLGMITEPIVYLVVWSTVARSQGGSVGGFTPAQLAAYYIVWTLVRNVNIVFTPFGWEWRIREGKLSGMLLRPVHPIHYDLAYFAGWKLPVVVMWLPLAVVLSLVFHPAITVTPAKAGAFFVAIWGAYLIRSMFMWVLGMVTFWTTRVTALYMTYFTLEVLLSGRIVPLGLMPSWAQALADFLPYKWTFGFPIETLAANLGGVELLAGLGAQVLWTGAGVALVAVVWRFGVRRYAAVGN
jgi:ABC-2 type transport system permease protein